jgi:N-acetyl-anhydromuramyl-L-alanine amidase AmpD
MIYLLLLLACSADSRGDVLRFGEDDTDAASDTDVSDTDGADTDDGVDHDLPDDDPPDDDTGAPVNTGHVGYIGSSCVDIGDCTYTDAECIPNADDWTDGHCTQECTQYCPDQTGAPTTFCIEPPDRAGGHCVSKCDWGMYPVDGCRSDYVCVYENRINSSTSDFVCLPDAITPTSTQPCSDPRNLAQDDDCYLELASFGDPVMRSLQEKLLAGSHTQAEALEWLDLDWEWSQDFIENDLGKTIHANYSSGHSTSSPMVGAIVHYTAAQTEDGTIGYFVGSNPHASTHWVIGSYRNGLPVQIFSHEHRTWHAGSTYNIDRFGIDFANAGYLDWSGSVWETYSGTDYTTVLPLFGNDPVHVDDGIPSASTKYANKDDWQPYTYHQLLSYITVIRALDSVYGMDPGKIERHGDVSSSRVDPGPQFPFSYINDLALSSDDAFSTQWLNDFKNDPDWIVNNSQAR